MAYLVALIAACVLCRSLQLRALSARHELMQVSQRGLLRLELRRKAELVCHSDGCGGMCLPSPRETRSLVLVLGCFQLWAKRESVALPAALQDSIDSVQAADGDTYFPACFCIRASQQTPSLFHAHA